MMLEEVVKELGFENEKEFHSIVANVDIASAKKLEDFRKWQFEDGTKEGLQKLPKRRNNG